MIIKEVIVVEGRDDITAVKAAVDAEVIQTGGALISKRNLKNMERAYKNSGLIIFTDPDYQGEKIRKRLAGLFPKAKHAFLGKEEASKSGDIGIENASPEQIRAALSMARPTYKDKNQEYEKADLIRAGLIGMPDSKRRREIFVKKLSLGYCNGKQLLSRLNSFNIKRDDFERAVEEMEREIND